MKKINKTLIITLLMLFGVVIFSGFTISPELSYAAGEMISIEDKPTGTIGAPFREAIRGVLDYFLGFLGLLAVIFVIYAGILMVTAQGEEDQVGKGKKILIWAAAGIIIILLSYTMVRMILTVPVA